MTQPAFLPFDVDLDTFIDELQSRLDADRARIKELLALEEKTYANFVRPFEMMDEHLGQFFTPMSHLHSVNNSENRRKSTRRRSRF